MLEKKGKKISRIMQVDRRCTAIINSFGRGTHRCVTHLSLVPSALPTFTEGVSLHSFHWSHPSPNGCQHHQNQNLSVFLKPSCLFYLPTFLTQMKSQSQCEFQIPPSKLFIPHFLLKKKQQWPPIIKLFSVATSFLKSCQL